MKNATKYIHAYRLFSIYIFRFDNLKRCLFAFGGLSGWGCIFLIKNFIKFADNYERMWFPCFSDRHLHLLSWLLEVRTSYSNNVKKQKACLVRTYEASWINGMILSDVFHIFGLQRSAPAERRLISILVLKYFVRSTWWWWWSLCDKGWIWIVSQSINFL